MREMIDMSKLSNNGADTAAKGRKLVIASSCLGIFQSFELAHSCGTCSSRRAVDRSMLEICVARRDSERTWACVGSHADVSL